MTPLVYIVILNWNGWQDTLECIASLARLAYPNFRVVVVDNGSTDGSEEKIRAACPQVTVLQTGANLGFAGGNNVGIRYALNHAADYVWLLNNDTVVTAGALGAMLDTAFEQPKPSLVGSVLLFEQRRDEVQAWGGGQTRRWLGVTKHLTRPGRLDYITCASILLPRRALEDFGLFDEGFFLYWEDVDLCRRATNAGWSLAVAASSTVYHKHNASSKAATQKSPPFADIQFVSGMVRFFRKHGGAFGFIPIGVRLGGMLVNRLRRRQPDNFKQICLAAWRGFVQPIGEVGTRVSSDAFSPQSQQSSSPQHEESGVVPPHG